MLPAGIACAGSARPFPLLTSCSRGLLDRGYAQEQYSTSALPLERLAGSLQLCRQAHLTLCVGIQIAQLLPGSSYVLRLRATVKARPSHPSDQGTHELPPASPPPSDMVLVTTPPSCPGRPHPPALLAPMAQSLTVRWMPPAHVGGSLTLSYRLALRSADSKLRAHSSERGWTVIYEGPAVEVQVPNLVPARKYDFRLQVCSSPLVLPYHVLNARSCLQAMP